MEGIGFVKTHYSFLESNIEINNAFLTAQKYGYKYLAIADSSNFFAFPQIIKAAKKYDVKPIIGLEINLTYQELEGKVLLFAKSQKGVYNLFKISSFIANEKQIITLESLAKFSEGISFVLPHFSLLIEPLLRQQKQDEIILFFNSIKKTFVTFYCSLWINQIKKNKLFLLKLCHQEKITNILLNSILFIKKSNYIIPEILKAIKMQQKADLKSVKYLDNYLFEKKPLGDEWKDLETSTNIFYQDHSFDFSFKKTSILKYQTPQNIDGNTYLKSLCLKGLNKRLNQQITQKYLDRLNHELKIIFEMDFANYFLIVWDFIKFAYQNDILFGPGRGSAGGSLVAYCLGITNIDPLKYNLYFERFLNPKRISLPDIDIDFQDDRREEIINYVLEKYGYDKVAYISTFQTIKAKMAIRDVGRAMNIPLTIVDETAKAIPFTLNITLKQTYEKSLSFKSKINKSPQMNQLFKIALAIENCPRQLGTHAAGVVMANDDLNEIVPLVRSVTNVTQTQFSMYYLEDLGILKIDFLGLRNLTTIQNVIKSIFKTTKTKIDIRKIPLNDQKTFKLLKRVETEGIFQLESRGMKNVLKLMQCESLEELAITIALFRPGPMNNINQYVRRKNLQEEINYIHPLLEPILKSTQGIIVYQEQIIEIAIKIGNFSSSKADILRRAMSKKDVKLMEEMRKDFIDGSIKNNLKPEIALKIFNLIFEFANYGFNKSHATAYALIAYQLAYLKTHYPIYFMCALLTGVIGDENKINHYINECKKYKIRVLPPSINASYKVFVIEKNYIRFSLLSIKNVGLSAYRLIKEERNKNGFFKDIFDFVTRLPDIKKSTLEALIWAGAFDEFNLSRTTLFENLDSIIKYCDLAKKNNLLQLDNQIIPKPYFKNKKDHQKLILEKEKQYLGLYISSHPIKKIKAIITKVKGSVINICDVGNFSAKRRIMILGEVNLIRVITTKKHQKMAFYQVFDETGSLKIVVFPDLYFNVNEAVKKNQIYCFMGHIDPKDSQVFIAEKIKDVKSLIKTIKR